MVVLVGGKVDLLVPEGVVVQPLPTPFGYRPVHAHHLSSMSAAVNADYQLIRAHKGSSTTTQCPKKNLQLFTKNITTISI